MLVPLYSAKKCCELSTWHDIPVPFSFFTLNCPIFQYLILLMLGSLTTLILLFLELMILSRVREQNVSF